MNRVLPESASADPKLSLPKGYGFRMVLSSVPFVPSYR